MSASYPEVIQFFVPDGGADLMTDRPHDVVGRVLEPEQEDDDEDCERGETSAINRGGIFQIVLLFSAT